MELFQQCEGNFSISAWNCPDRVGVFFILMFGTVPTEWGYFFYYSLEMFRQSGGIFSFSVWNCSDSGGIFPISVWNCSDRVRVFFSISVWNCSDRVRVFVLLVFGIVPTE